MPSPGAGCRAYSSMVLSPFEHRSNILAPLLAAVMTAASAPAQDRPLVSPAKFEAIGTRSRHTGIVSTINV